MMGRTRWKDELKLEEACIGAAAVIHPTRPRRTSKKTQCWSPGLCSTPCLCVRTALATMGNVHRFECRTHGMSNACLELVGPTLKLCRCKHLGFGMARLVPDPKAHGSELQERGRWTQHCHPRALACLESRLSHVNFDSIPVNCSRSSASTHRQRLPANPNRIVAQRRSRQHRTQRKGRLRFGVGCSPWTPQ